MYSPSIQKLIEKFSKFPTVGPRTAARFVFYLLKLSKEEIKELTDSISDLKNNIKECQLCFNYFEPSFAKASEGKGQGDLCEICLSKNRDRSLLCIIANETDLIAIEKTKKYKGLYFILGGTVSALKKENIEKLRIQELEKRIKNSEGIINEIIIATNPNSEGEATALYLERLLKKILPGSRITRLGRGLPLGGELEYADEETLISALEGRK